MSNKYNKATHGNLELLVEHAPDNSDDGDWAIVVSHTGEIQSGEVQTTTYEFDRADALERGAEILKSWNVPSEVYDEFFKTRRRVIEPAGVDKNLFEKIHNAVESLTFVSADTITNYRKYLAHVYENSDDEQQRKNLHQRIDTLNTLISLKEKNMIN